MINIKKTLKDPRTHKVLGFFIAKKYLLGTHRFSAFKNVKLSIEDVLWVAQNFEPRVLEVFPAAFLHFPRTFIFSDHMPDQLKLIISKIKRNDPDGPDFKGIRYHNMKRWADLPLSDRRTKPLSQKRLNKTFRLQPNVINAIKKQSNELGVSETQFIERLILELE